MAKKLFWVILLISDHFWKFLDVRVLNFQNSSNNFKKCSVFYDFASTQKFYRKEYKRLLKENGELWEENQKIKKSYDALKAKIFNFPYRLGRPLKVKE